MSTSKKRKQSEISSKPEKLKPETLRVLSDKFPEQYLTKDGKEPRTYKGDYLCHVFSRVQFGREASQLLRTRTVTCGFQKGVKPEVLTSFQGKVDKAVNFLSEERVMGSLLANYIFLDACKHGQTPPSPNGAFWNACMASCSTSRAGNKWALREKADAFLNATGLEKLVYPKMNLGQQRVYLANEMATATSTRVSIHTENRRISLLKWFLSDTIPRTAGVEKKAYSSDRHSLAEKMLVFDGSPEKTANMRDLVSKMNPDFDPSVIIEAARREVGDFHETKEEDDKLISEKVILHLYNLFEKYVGDSRKTYERVVQDAAMKLFPGKEHQRERSDLIKQGWSSDFTPPKHASILPICSSKAVFIRIESRGLREWGIKNSNDAWWFEEVLQPFSEEANIKCLRNKENVARGTSLEKFVKALENKENKVCPWLVGTSFLTDGVQLKIHLVTLASSHPEFSGSSALDEKGYSKLPRADVGLGTLISRRRGVYNIGTVTPCTPGEIPDETIIMSADPGQAKIINVSRAEARVWKENDPGKILNSSDFVSDVEYREKIRAKDAEEYEVRRRERSEDYRKAVKNLGDVVKKTSCIKTFLEYCKSWATNCVSLFKEVLRVQRKRGRFSRFRAVQSTLSMVADKYVRGSGSSIDRWT